MPGTGLALADDERDAGLLDVVIMDLTFFQISNPSPEIAEAIKSLRFIHQNMVARLHEGIMFERMIQDLYVDLESPTCPAWEHDSE